MAKSDRFKRKNVLFDPDDTKDMELLKQLRYLPYGEFSKMTKELWRLYFNGFKPKSIQEQYEEMKKREGAQ